MYSFPKVCDGKLIIEIIAIARVRVIEAIGDPMFPLQSGFWYF